MSMCRKISKIGFFVFYFKFTSTNFILFVLGTHRGYLSMKILFSCLFCVRFSFSYRFQINKKSKLNPKREKKKKTELQAKKKIQFQSLLIACVTLFHCLYKN